MKERHTSGFAPSRTATGQQTATGRLLLVTLLLFTFLGEARAQETLTVYDGTNTSSYVPVYGLWADNSLQCEIIYPATELEDMAGGEISALKFYTNSTSTNIGTASASNNWDGTFTIFMKEVETTTLSAFTGTTGSNTVLEAQIGVVNGEMTIEFDDTYTYGGGNLLVGVYYATGGHYCSVNWIGNTMTGASIYGRSGQNYSATQGNFIPKTTFTYTPGNGPTCAKPSSFEVSNVDAHSASFAWTSEVGNYTLEYKKASESEWTVVSDLTNTTYSLSNLVPATAYNARVKAVCGADLESGYRTTNFTTPCEIISTYPWTENFDSYTGVTSGSTNNLPMCWNYINGTTYSYYSGYPVIYNSSSYSNSGSNYLYFYSSYPNSVSYTFTDLYAILPEMEGLNGMMLTLYAKAYNANSSFTVGMMTDPADASTFVAIDTKSPSTTEYEKFTFILGEGNYVAIKMEPANSSVANRSIRIDDLMIDEVPTCLEPTDLEFAGSTTHTATLSWMNGSNDQAAWQICLNGDEDNLIAANSNPFTIEGLDPSSAYTAKVRAYCSETDQSDWSKEVGFTTACDAISTLPWNENFDAYTAAATSTTTPTVYPNVELPVCWQFLNRSESNSAYPQTFLTSANSYAVSGNCLFFKSSSETPLYGILPEFAEDIANLMLTFTYRNEGVSTSNGTLIVGYMTDPADATTFTSVLTCEQTTTKTEMEVLFTGAPAGSYIAFKYQGGSTNNYYLAIDDVTVGPIPSCKKPSGLTKDATTAHTATLHWTNGMEGQDAWQIAYSTTADFNPDEVTPVDVTTNPATISGLEANTTYYAYVRANCGNGDLSAWCKNKTSFITLVGNAVPTGLAYDPASLTSSEVSVSWTGVATNELHESFDLYYSTESTMPAELVADNLITGITESSYHFETLTPETQYYVWVRDNCGADGYSVWSSPISITTASNCQIPDGLAATETTNTSAVISWNGYGQEYFNLQYSADGETWETIENVANPCTLTGLRSNTSYQVEVQPICSPDEWSAAMSFPTACEAVTEFPWSEDFENFNASSSGVKLDDNCWVNEHIEGNGTYFFEVYSNTTATGGNSTKMLRLHDMTAGTKTKLMLPEMNLPGDNYEFSIGVYRSNYSTIKEGEGIRVFASTNGEIDGANELAFIPRQFSVSSSTIDAEDAVGWYTYELPIGLSGTCYIILRGESEYGAATYMDNFAVKEMPTCVKPANLTVTDITTTTATLSWTPGSVGQDAWQICLNGDEEHLIMADSNPFTIDNLTAATTYTAKVRACCSADDYSDWSKTVTFTTDCAVITALPWSVDFESFTADKVPGCWDNSASTSSSLSNNPHYIWGVYSYDDNKMLRMCNYLAVEGLALINTPVIELPSEGAYQLTFDYAHNADCGDFEVKISEDNGTTFTELASYSKGSGSSYSEPGTFTEAEPVDLAAYAGKSVILQFYATANYSSGAIFVDNILIDLAPTCIKPTGLGASNITFNSVDLSWTANNDPTKWQICLNGDQTNLIDVSNAEVDLQSPTYTLTGLDAETAYTVKIRAYCDENNQSGWSNEVSFTTTLIPVPTITGITTGTHKAVISTNSNADNFNVRYRNITHDSSNYDFEDGVQGWTVLKGTTGNSPHNWMHNTAYTAYDSNGNQIDIDCHNSSSGMMLSESYISAATSGGSGTAVTPDNYLVSPQIQLGGSISFYAAARMSNYPEEKFSVLVSESGNTSVSDFTHTELTVTLSDNEWKEYSVDLSAYSGMGYVAIRHYDCYDQHLLYIDDVTIVHPLVWQTSNSLTLTNLDMAATYEVQVQAIYDVENGLSDWSESETFTTLSSINLTLADNDLEKADNEKNGYLISQNDGEMANVTLSGRTLWKDGYWNTLCLPFAIENLNSTTLAGATVMELNGTTSNLTDGTLTLNFTDASSIEVGKPYLVRWGHPVDLTINTADDWNDFATAVAGGNTYAGKSVKLGNDITVSTIVGSWTDKNTNHVFSGTFDGDGHTLTLDLNGSAQGCAPFGAVGGATIINLNTTGTVKPQFGSKNNEVYHASGLVGFANGATIVDCHVSANILFPANAGTVHSGGIIGHALSAPFTMTNCLFDGSIGYVESSTSTMTNVGGLVGWDDNSTPNINYCINAGSFANPGTISKIARVDGRGTIANSFSTTNATSSGSHNDDRGTYTSSIGSDLLSLLGQGWKLDGPTVVPKMFSTATIVDPVFSDVIIYATMNDVSTSDGKVTFKGTYNYQSFNDDNRSILFLGDNNKLYWPQSGASIGAFRAYFQLNNGITAGDISEARLFFGDGSSETSSLNDKGKMINDKETGAWYTVNGVKLDKKPTRNGLYIHNGKKVVVK